MADNTTKYVKYAVGGLLALGALSLLVTPKTAPAASGPKTAATLQPGDRFTATSTYDGRVHTFVATKSPMLQIGQISAVRDDGLAESVPLSAIITIL